MSKIPKFVASIIELFSRSVETFDKKEIYRNDVDNLYPNRVELIEKNSPTASSASNKLKSFIIGKGFLNQNLNEIIVNPKKKKKAYSFLQDLAESLKTHKGAFIHVNYSLDGNVNFLEVLKYKKCRITKEDSFGFPGKIYYKDWNNKADKSVFSPKDKTSDQKWFYPFNKDNKIIMKQRLNDVRLKDADASDPVELVRKYRGQVYFFSLEENETYPHAWIHPAYNDADSEYRMSLYRNTNLRTGFIDKTVIIPNGLDEESRNEFDSKVKEWLGVENTSSVFVFKPEEHVQDLDNIIKTIKLEGSYDSKRFELDEKAFTNNIRKAYLTIPKILIDPEDSFFGSSGEAFVQAIKYYNQETLFIREKIAYMMDLFFNSDFTIKELDYGTSIDM